jgi:cytochrome P450
LACPLLAIVIVEMLGAPPEARGEFKVCSQGVLAFQGMGIVTAEVLDHSQQHLQTVRAFLMESLIDRRQRPQDDLLSRLDTAVMEGGRLTEAEFLTTCVTLLTAGHVTTTNLTANRLYTLLRHPAEMECLRAHPALMPAAEPSGSIWA